MNVLDENIPANQRQRLDNWRIRPRQIGFNIGGEEWKMTKSSRCYTVSDARLSSRAMKIPLIANSATPSITLATTLRTRINHRLGIERC
ncbi:MAG TPA: hypothetical protein VJH03_12130 [Blastocatellia bacterium]|nr:hypothetical protein [Blastocatellia bacterium]